MRYVATVRTLTRRVSDLLLYREQYQKLLNTCSTDAVASAALKASLFMNQGSSFAFSQITDEDAATQAIAEILDWLVLHLHRFRIAAATSDTDPWYGSWSS